MVDSPFETTIYMDADTLPCSPLFHKALFNGLNGADIALTMEDGRQSSDITHTSHYISRGDPNQHNSAPVVLDMTSNNTRAMLEVYKSIFFSKDDPLPTLDQPSLGEAMHMTSMAGNLTHVDFPGNTVCRKRIFGGEIRCGAGCIVAHKTRRGARFGVCLTGDCIRDEASRIARALPQTAMTVSGEGGKGQLDVLLVKTPGCASSTMEGVARRVANKHGSNYVEWRHRAGHEYKNSVDRSRTTFLITSVRDPASRAISRYYRFTHVNTTDDEETLLQFLQTTASTDDDERSESNWAATSHEGGYQLRYTSLYNIPSNSAWSPQKPSDVLHPARVVNNVKKVIEDYNFIAVAERMDESLVALAITMGIPLSDVVVLQVGVPTISKEDSSRSGETVDYSNEKDDQSCYSKILPATPPEKRRIISTVVEEYFNSLEWRAKNYGDYLLHEAASQSLDRTIEETIGVDIFEKALLEYRELLSKHGCTK